MNDAILFLADIKGSSRLPDAGAVYRRLDAVIADWNSTDSFVVPLTRQYGDEVVAIMREVTATYRMASALRDALYPDTGLRWALVRGKAGDLSALPSQIGGEVFKRGSAMLSQLKRDRRWATFGVDRDRDEALASLCNLANTQLEGFTRSQREIYLMVREGLTHDEIARKIGKHRQSVSRTILKADMDNLRATDDVIDNLLKQIEAAS